MTRMMKTPRAALALALALAAALAAACGGAKGPAGTPTPVEPAGPPQGEPATAEAVIEASIAAQGGRERIGKIGAMRQTGTFSIVQMGMKGSLTSVTSAPHNLLLLIDLPGIGKISQGVSGDLAWDMNPMTGARIITGDERTQLLRESRFNGELVWKELYPKAELAGVSEFAGQAAYKVVLTAADGDTQTRYFAKDTKLPLGVQMVIRSQMGQVPAEVTLSDWREVGGIKLAHKMLRAEGPQTVEITFDQIELDPALDPATFAVPPEITALQPKG